MKRYWVIGLAGLTGLGFSGATLAEPSEIVRRVLPNARTDAATEHCLLPIVDAIYEKESLVAGGLLDAINAMVLDTTATILRRTKWDTKAPDADFREMKDKAEKIIAENIGQIEVAKTELREIRREARADCEQAQEKELGCTFMQLAESHKAAQIALQQDGVATQQGYLDYAECVLGVRGR